MNKLIIESRNERGQCNCVNVIGSDTGDGDNGVGVGIGVGIGVEGVVIRSIQHQVTSAYPVQNPVRKSC